MGTDLNLVHPSSERAPNEAPFFLIKSGFQHRLSPPCRWRQFHSDGGSWFAKSSCWISCEFDYFSRSQHRLSPLSCLSKGGRRPFTSATTKPQGEFALPPVFQHGLSPLTVAAPVQLVVAGVAATPQLRSSIPLTPLPLSST